MPPAVPNGIIIRYTAYIDLLNGTTKFETINGATNNLIVANLSPYQLIQVDVSASTVRGEGPRNTPAVMGRSLEDSEFHFKCLFCACCVISTSPPLAIEVYILTGVVDMNPPVHVHV